MFDGIKTAHISWWQCGQFHGAAMLTVFVSHGLLFSCCLGPCSQIQRSWVKPTQKLKLWQHDFINELIFEFRIRSLLAHEFYEFYALGTRTASFPFKLRPKDAMKGYDSTDRQIGEGIGRSKKPKEAQNLQQHLPDVPSAHRASLDTGR